MISVDWNFWGNFLFLVASCCYVATAVLYNEYANWLINLIAALIFVVDSLIYIMGWYVDCRMEPEVHKLLEDVQVDTVAKSSTSKMPAPLGTKDIRGSDGFLARRHAALIAPLPNTFERDISV